MVILESCRRAGKSYTCEIVERYFQNVEIYKDLGMRIVGDINSNIDVDDYSIGRDLAYAQVIPILPSDFTDRLLIDRQYLSSCVYGRYYRNKYDLKFWIDHLKRVERLYKDLGTNIKHAFLTLKEEDFHRMASMNRKKDNLETNDEDSYREQYSLYEIFLNETVFDIVNIEAFRDEDYIINKILETGIG